MLLASGSLSRHWAMGACLLLLWAAATPTPTQARFIAKRETAHVVDMGVVDAHTADPDIVRASSESASGSTTETTASHAVKNATEVELLLTTSATTETSEQQASGSNSAAELKSKGEGELELATTTTESTKLAVISSTEAQAAEVKLENNQMPVNSNAAEALNSSSSAAILLDVTTTEMNELLKQSAFNSSLGILQNVTTKNVQQKSTTVIPNVEYENQQQLTELQTEQATTPTTTTTTTTSTTTRSLVTTQRGEDHARSMQFPLSTESGSQLSAVTPMKLRALPMKTTTTTTTHMPQLLAPLLHAGVTAAPSASHENAIEEEQPQLQHEKRAKYISDNATNAQQLLLPNGAEVWSLAAMKMVPTTTTTTTSPSTTELANDIEQLLNRTEQHKEKNILDWQQIMLMQTSQENRTESTMSTTLDATEAATQATTIKLNTLLDGNREMEMSASSAVTASTHNNMTTTESRRQDATLEITTTENVSAPGMKAKSELAPTELEKLRAKEVAASYNSAPNSHSAINDNAWMNLTALAGLQKLSSTTAATTTSTAQPDLAEPVKINLTESAVAATAQPELTEPVKLSIKGEADAAATATATATAQPELTEPKLNLTAAPAVEADATTTSTATAAANATTAKPETAATTMPPAALPTAEPEQPPATTATTTITTTTTALPSALNGGTPNANEMAMKATAHENNEKSDKSNNVDSDDVINVSVSGAVSVSTEATLAAITVSTRTAGEASTTTTPTSTPRTLLDEQLVKTTTTITLATPTPTPTEIVQISNEVNLETITVQNVTKDKSNKNNVQASDINNLLITNGEAKNNNSEFNSQTQPINNSIYSTTTAETTTTPTSLLTDLKANSKLNEQETNNIGETETTAAATTTTPPTTEATTATVRSIATTETAAVAVVNALDESTATTSVVTAATPATAAAKDALDPFGDRDSNKDNDDNVDVEKDDDEEHKQQQIEHDSVTEQQLLSKVNMANETTTSKTTTSEGTTRTTEGTTTTTTTTTETTTTTTTTTSAPTTTTTEEPFISLLDDSTTTTTTTSTTARTTPTTTTTTEPVYSSTTNVNININSNTFNKSNSMLPVASSTVSIAHINVESTTAKPTSPTINNIMVAGVNHVQQPHGNTGGTDVNVIIAITVSVIGVVALVLLVGFLYFMRKRQKQTSYGQRCRPVSLDAYSLDNVSVLGSVRRKGRDLRASKRTYGNAAFDDPSLRHNLLSATELAKFAERRSSIYEEFRDVPQISARPDEVPAGCEDKNRFANIIPLPETRVVLQRQADDDKTEYINANYVRGPHDAPNYYIACQAPMESTTGDFWRMIWEQQSRVIVQATDLSEEGIERCAEYLPPSVTLDNHSNYGDFQVTLKHREVKDKYAISTLMLKRVDGAECRELTHYWYKWPEAGVPLEEAPIIAMLLEARSSLKSYALEQANELKHEKSSTLTLKSMEGQTQQTAVDADKCSTSSAASNEINGNVANKTPRSQQGPLTIHCSPGTGRTGTIIACDMAIRSLETPKRSVDIPQLVYYVRRGRAKAVQTREQYEFIYKVANMYATKITNLSNDN